MTVAKRNICGDLKPGFNFSKVKKTHNRRRAVGNGPQRELIQRCTNRSHGIPFNHSWAVQHISNTYSIDLITWGGLAVCSQNVTIHIPFDRSETNDMFLLKLVFTTMQATTYYTIWFTWSSIYLHRDKHSNFATTWILLSIYNLKRSQLTITHLRLVYSSCTHKWIGDLVLCCLKNIE